MAKWLEVCEEDAVGVWRLVDGGCRDEAGNEPGNEGCSNSEESKIKGGTRRAEKAEKGDDGGDVIEAEWGGNGDVREE